MKRALILAISLVIIAISSFGQSANESYVGIGTWQLMLNDTLTLLSVDYGQPAYKAGLEEGDKIITINDIQVSGIGFDEGKAIDILRGEGVRGSSVKLKIKRQNNFHEVKVIRTEISLLYPELAQDDNDMYGYQFDRKWIIDPVYDYAWQFHDGLALVVQYDDNADKWKHAFIDRNGNTILSVNYEQVQPFFDGLATVLSNGKWGAINKKGELIIPCKYDEPILFTEGLAAVKINNKWGYIDRYGKMIIQPEYETADMFQDNLAMISKGNETTFIEHPLRKTISDIDINIPVINTDNDETFAFIFANEKYMSFSVPFANNDGKSVKEYCGKTLGIPEKNIRFYENATYGNMVSAINKIKEIAGAYEGDASFIIYYSGQGLTDEKSKIPYLLPVDAVLANISRTGYSVEKLNSELSQIPAKSILLIVDACFNGCDREGKMLTAARGVTIKPRPNHAEGSLIVLSASSGDETAYSYKEQNHGLFTYFLLKKIKEAKGNITYKALADYITVEVKRQSTSKAKLQQPTIIVSEKLNDWQMLRVK